MALPAAERHFLRRNGAPRSLKLSSIRNVFAGDGEQTIRHRFDRHELDARCCWPTSRRRPRASSSRARSARGSAKVWASADGSATSRCSERSMRSRSSRERCRGHYVRLFAVATSALRRAENGEEFAERVSGPARRSAAHPLRRRRSGGLVSRRADRVRDVARRAGRRARCWAAAAPSMPSAIRWSPKNVVSCEIGAVRLTEAVPALAGRDGAVERAAVAARSRDRARKRSSRWPSVRPSNGSRSSAEPRRRSPRSCAAAERRSHPCR